MARSRRSFLKDSVEPPRSAPVQPCSPLQPMSRCSWGTSRSPCATAWMCRFCSTSTGWAKSGMQLIRKWASSGSQPAPGIPAISRPRIRSGAWTTSPVSVSLHFRPQAGSFSSLASFRSHCLGRTSQLPCRPVSLTALPGSASRRTTR